MPPKARWPESGAPTFPESELGIIEEDMMQQLRHAQPMRMLDLLGQNTKLTEVARNMSLRLRLLSLAGVCLLPHIRGKLLLLA